MKLKSNLAITLVVAITLSCLFLGSLTGQIAGPPAFVDYQGRVLDDTGAPLSPGSATNFTMHFRIYDDAEASQLSNIVWAEKQVVTVLNGEFSVRLGEGDEFSRAAGDARDEPHDPLSSAFDGNSRFLGVSVALTTGQPPAGEIQPRLAFLSSPFSFVAERARTADTVIAGAIGTEQLALDAVTSSVIVAGSISGDRLQAGTVTWDLVAPRLKEGALIAGFPIFESELTTGIHGGQIRVNTIEGINIKDGTITSADIKNSTITGSKIANSTITGGHIAANTITASDIATGAVRSTEILDGTITSSDIASSVGIWSRSGMDLHHDGNVGIGNTDPETKLHVEGGGDASLLDDGSLLIGDKTGANMVFDENEIMARNNGAAAALYLNHEGGETRINSGAVAGATYINNTDGWTYINSSNDDGRLLVGQQSDDIKIFFGQATAEKPNGTATFVCAGSALKPGGGAWTALSDRRLKKNIKDLEGSLDRLLRLRSRTFEFKDPNKGYGLPGVNTGFVAQEVEEVFPEWVGDGLDGFKAISVTGFTSMAVQALRELRAEKDEQIQDLADENSELKERLACLEKAVGNLVKPSAK